MILRYALHLPLMLLPISLSFSPPPPLFRYSAPLDDTPFFIAAA